MDFIQACKKLISIDSSPSNGTGEAARFIKKLGESMGFTVRLEEEIQRGISEANVLCFANQEVKDVELMLQTHLDTVDPGSFALWNKTGKNPFHATIHNDQIYGLGSADTKLDFLCKLFAAKKFIGKKTTKPFAIVGTFGEEYNMQGAIRLVRHKLLQPKYALVSEPTEFCLVHSGKGLANIEITLPFSKEEMDARHLHDTGESQSAQCKIFRGKAAHSSQPLKGENAIEKVFDYLQNLPDQLLLLEIDGGTNYNTIPVQSVLEFDLITTQGITLNQKIVRIYNKIQNMQVDFNKVLDENFDPPMTTFNIGMVRTYSDHIKMMGCVRWPAKVGEETYKQWMEDLRLFCESLGCVFRVRDYKKPFSIDPKSPFAKACLSSIDSVVGQKQLATQPVTNEANVFNKFGIETLVFGPGVREGNSQTPSESISIESLLKAQEIYENIIHEICYTGESS